MYDIASLGEDFDEKTQDFKKNEIRFQIFSTPFSANVEKVPSNMQMKLIELQCSCEEAKSPVL